MTRATVVVMPGDGIGRAVVPEALRALDAAGAILDVVEAPIGWERWVRDGDALPEGTLALLRRHGVGLLGAVTSRPKDEAERELSPPLRGRGLVYQSPVIALRQRLGLDVAVRPCRSIPHNPRNFVRRRGDGLEEPPLDVTVIMQNTECLYTGLEWTDPPAALYRELAKHPQMARVFGDVPRGELSLSCRVVSRRGAVRAAEEAFEHATRHGKSSVTLCDKWGVMRETGARMLEGAREVASRYPGVALRTVNFDALALSLTRAPERYEVILASALVGDVISDGFGGLVGGLGFTPSASLGAGCAVFEPVHGSAPALVTDEGSIANPIAAILAGAMLLEHLGDGPRAALVRGAVDDVVREGRVQTYDLRGWASGPGVLARGAASTRQMGDAIVEAVRARRRG
jgi:3-isopropylmalate dehydrogenase